MTKPKRDHAEGAVPAAHYYKTSSHGSKVTEAIKSKRRARINISNSETRNVRESVIQGEISRYLKTRCAWVHKAKAVNLVGDGTLASTQQGVPDLLCCYEGVFLALEIKAASNKAKVSGEQLAQMDAIASCGGVVAVVWSIDQVEAILDAIDQDQTQEEIGYMTAGYLRQLA